MPTPVAIARQCLTPEAAPALDDAVAVARRRGHAQTTSLHAISALLSLPSSILRDACARARNTAYSPRLQFKALELCLSVSLDRLPSTQISDDPPVSNSLMAAIKRSQANQRRQPENFHIYHQISQQSASVSSIKVELQHLILSILDDPVVSRVFAEAGFRSSEIKLAILRPLPHLLRYSRSRGSPLFLCNLTDDLDRRSFNFPFSVLPGVADGDDDFRRIADVLARKRDRSPLLLGAHAHSALRIFVEAVRSRREGVLPVELAGLSVICIEQDIFRFINENSDKRVLCSRFCEMGLLVKRCLDSGLLVNFGDLKSFACDDGSREEAVSYVVSELTKLLEVNNGKLWLMGAAVAYENYLKFVTKFPSVEKDWGLQLLPITSVRPPMFESYPRPKSRLMDSFVPFGGFFSLPSELNYSSNGSYGCASHCHTCYENCDQEVMSCSKKRTAASVAEGQKSNLPSWLQMAEYGTTNDCNMKDTDDCVMSDHKEASKKLEKICHCLPRTQHFPAANTSPTVVGFQFSKDKKGNAENFCSNNIDTSTIETGRVDLNSCIPLCVQEISVSQSSTPFPVANNAENNNVPSNFSQNASIYMDDFMSNGLRYGSFSNSSVVTGSQTSPTSVSSLTTELGLGICSSSSGNKPTYPANKCQKVPPEDSAGHFSSNFMANGYLAANQLAQSSSCSSSDYGGHCDPRDLKMLIKALTEKVSCQDEAISVIGETIVCCKASRVPCRENARGGIWLNFVGPDSCSKRKIVVSLAKLLYGSQENLIHLDLSSQETNGHDIKFRGKTVVDYIVGELCKEPLSVVFLENVDKADVVAQQCLSHAVRTRKISNSCGREIGITNALFVTTSSSVQSYSLDDLLYESAQYSEEKILRAKPWPVQITVQHSFGGYSTRKSLSPANSTTNDISIPLFLNKRKLIHVSESVDQHKISEVAKRALTSKQHLDLNLPAADIALYNSDDGNSENEKVALKQSQWLQDLFDHVHKTVIFKPYNFDALAEELLNKIEQCFHRTVASECVLEIESKVMEQLLAAAYVLDRKKEVEDWVEQVLSRGFAEVNRRYNLSAHATVKLTSWEGHLPDQAPSAFLPSRIMIN